MVRADDDAFPKVVCPVTEKVEAVVVARVVVPDTKSNPPMLRFPVAEAFVTESLPGMFKLVIVDEEIVVVAREVVPRTTNGPVDVDPVGLDKKLRFSVHEVPFQ